MRIFLLTCAAMAVATGVSAAPVVFDFSSHHNNLGPDETYMASGLSIVAHGYDQSNHATDLFGKHAAGDEKGLGLANDPSGDDEIHLGYGFVELDLNNLRGNVLANSLQFGTNSTTDHEAWAVYATNHEGGMTSGVNVTSGQTEGLHSLSGLDTYRYFDFYETAEKGGENFLISSLSATSAVPEPATWAMMLLGFGGLGASLRRRRAAGPALAA
ncbi:MAG: PEPxxWA-CTERM sorting domain-containing protein [Caulobacterales bacterium]|jgi:hypothetical protein